MESDYWMGYNEAENGIDLIIDDNSTTLKLIVILLTGDSSKYVMRFRNIFAYSKPNTSQNIMCRTTVNYLVCSMSDEIQDNGVVQSTDYVLN